MEACRESVITNLVVSTLFIIAVTIENSAACLADGQRDMRPGFSQDGKVTFTSLPSCFCRMKTLNLPVGGELEILERLISPREWQWVLGLFTTSCK